MRKVGMLGKTTHVCKRTTNQTPHVGFPGKKSKNDFVFVNGIPILLKGDKLMCNAPPLDMPVISEGSDLLFINGCPAALEGSDTNHDSKLLGGSDLLMVES